MRDGVFLWVSVGEYFDLGGANSNIFLFSSLGEDEPILTVAYFSNGLVKNHQLVDGWVTAAAPLTTLSTYHLW